ncbi:MAG: hypothetical protein HZB39_13365 [Planctomycetes bacterium]|nr:hypothetical protein [Planctomycetota bacterium]
MIGRSLAATVVFATVVPAQVARWNLPADRSLIYDRERTVNSRAIDPQPKPGAPVPPAFGVPGTFGAGVLLGVEIDQKGRGQQREPFDLAELVPFLAFDLGTFKAGKARIEAPAVKPFGKLVIEVDGAAPSADGEQVLRCRIQRGPLDESRVPGPARERKERYEALQRSYDHGLEATLEITRRHDASASRVREFDARLDGTVALPAGREWKHVGITVEERWRLREELIADNGAFRERVGEAIRIGREHLLGKLDEQIIRLPEPPPANEPHVDHGAGEIALLALTVLKAGVRRDDPTLLDALEVLRTRRLRDTYTVSIALMALEAFHADPNERQHILEGLIDGPRKRTPGDADRATMTRWVAQLLDNRDSRPDKAKASRWTYNGGEDFDHSNTQYALLGLWSAQLCGIDVPVEVWTGAARHWIELQCQSEGTINLGLLTYRQLAQNKGRTTSTGVDARGWSYRYPGEGPYGSMTAAGTASLLIVQAALRERGTGRSELLGEIGRSVRSGYAWLAKHLDVRSNPGRPAEYDAWRSYWLYGLERACELGQIARLGERDWYFEGASLLLAMQREDGHFEPGSIVDDCFAVLFLKKAQVPVSTGR